MLKGNMKKFIKSKLHEAFGSSATLPENIEVDEKTLILLKNMSWNNINIEPAGDDGHSKINMDVIFNDPQLQFVSNGIVFTIQLISDTYYHPHLFIAKSIQGIGLGAKIFKAFIMEFGHIYVTEARTLNKDAFKMINKLVNDPDFETIKSDLGVMIIKKGNPDTDALKNFVN